MHKKPLEHNVLIQIAEKLRVQKNLQKNSAVPTTCKGRIASGKRKVLQISNVHSERKIFAIFKLSRIWLLNTFKNDKNFISSLLTLTLTTKAIQTNSNQNYKL